MKKINHIDIFSGDDWTYVYLNDRLLDSSSSFPKMEIFEMCKTAQPFTYSHYTLVSDHWDQDGWTYGPETKDEIMKFVQMREK